MPVGDGRTTNEVFLHRSVQDFLGQGSFGFVTMVRKKEGAMEGCLFALKSLSKLAVVEGGQVQHIKDEKSVRVWSKQRKVQNKEAAQCTTSDVTYTYIRPPISLVLGLL